LSLILLLLGLGILAYGRISFGEIQAEGPPVRAAGFILMMPFIATLFLGEIMRMLFDDASGTGTILGIIDLIAMVVCVGVAYTLVFNTAQEQGNGPTIINLPQFGRNNKESENTQNSEQDDTQNTSETVSKVEQPPRPVEKPQPTRQPQIRPRRNRNERSYPNVMSTAEAASYLDISENDLMKLIDQGKIAAARINYRYRISRAVLDEFISDQGSTATD